MSAQPAEAISGQWSVEDDLAEKQRKNAKTLFCRCSTKSEARKAKDFEKKRYFTAKTEKVAATAVVFWSSVGQACRANNVVTRRFTVKASIADVGQTPVSIRSLLGSSLELVFQVAGKLRVVARAVARSKSGRRPMNVAEVKAFAQLSFWRTQKM